MRGQFPHFDVTDDGGDRLQDMAIERDGPGGPAVQAFHKTVVHSLLDRVAPRGLHAEVLLGLEFPQLRGDLGTCAAGNFMPPPCLPVRPVTDGDGRVPAALGLILVDRSLAAPATPASGDRFAHGGSLTRLAPRLAPEDCLLVRFIPSTWWSYGDSNPRPLACHETPASSLTRPYAARTGQTLADASTDRLTPALPSGILPVKLPLGGSGRAWNEP